MITCSLHLPFHHTISYRLSAWLQRRLNTLLYTAILVRYLLAIYLCIPAYVYNRGSITRTRHIIIPYPDGRTEGRKT
jgi:hypothetical protein